MTSRNAGDYIEATIVASTTVRIERLNNNSAWEHPVHAINWFDTRLLLLYNFYNLLAGRSVARVGGTPLVKGKLISRIVGTDASQRQILLLVRYPSPAQFKTMLESTYFKLVSVLRGLAVKNFTFCLSHAQGVTPVADINTQSDTKANFTPDDKLVSNSDEKLDKNNDRFESTGTVFGIHHFRGDDACLEGIRNALALSSLNVTFSSLKTHQLSVYKGNSLSQTVPSIMDGIVLFNCSDAMTLERVTQSTEYQSAIEQTESSFIGLYQRLV